MDPIVDLLNRIRNAQAVNKQTVDLPFSKVKYQIAQVMEKYAFIAGISKIGKKENRILKITLQYDKDKNPRISGLKRVSTQGQRIYSNYKELKPVKGGSGIAIISTSRGIMSHIDALRKKVGGEVIAKIW